MLRRARPVLPPLFEPAALPPPAAATANVQGVKVVRAKRPVEKPAAELLPAVAQREQAAASMLTDGSAELPAVELPPLLAAATSGVPPVPALGGAAGDAQALQQQWVALQAMQQQMAAQMAQQGVAAQAQGGRAQPSRRKSKPKRAGEWEEDDEEEEEPAPAPAAAPAPAPAPAPAAPAVVVKKRRGRPPKNAAAAAAGPADVEEQGAAKRQKMAGQVGVLVPTDPDVRQLAHALQDNSEPYMQVGWEEFCLWRGACFLHSALHVSAPTPAALI